MCDFGDRAVPGREIRPECLQCPPRPASAEPLTQIHFQRWLDIWEGAADDLFAGPKAIEAKVQAGRITGSISRRLERTVVGELLTIMSRRQ